MSFHLLLSALDAATNPGFAISLKIVVAVVLIEDDPHIRRLAAESLAKDGFDVETAGGAMEGLQMVVAQKPDVVVLDLGLPDLDGVELLRMLRAISSVPVIVATAREGDSHVVAALDSGADDYLVKPYSVTQLAARIRAVLRRAETRNTEVPISIGGLKIDRQARDVTLEGVSLVLSPKEFDLLALLAERSGEVVTKRELLAEVWRQPYGGGDRTVASICRRSARSSASRPATRASYKRFTEWASNSLIPTAARRAQEARVDGPRGHISGRGVVHRPAHAACSAPGN